ncbi:MAG: SteA C-terminal domain-containing protein, partial [Corynebacterium casei]|uniref:SteA domain-containing protein n=2 Tax=Corynebacterium casei TaxID=160386 RepID=UPI0026470FA6
GTAEGLERIQDLGIGAMTFPAATDSATDLALLLADFHEAELIVQVGDSLDLDDIFAAKEHATPAAMLTRLKAGNRLVDSSAIINLYTVRTGGSMAWLWAVLGVLVALAVIVLVVGLGGDGTFANNLIDTWNNIALTFQGWF